MKILGGKIMGSYDQGYVCIECECLYDESDGDIEKRMCNECIDKILEEDNGKTVHG